MTRLIGTVDIIDGIICVSKDNGLPIKDFISWSAFERWLIENNFDYRFNYVCQGF